MRTILKFSIIFPFILLLILTRGHATNNGKIYYVATNGNNSNPGTIEKPWKTPGFGSRQLKPGETLIILGGEYILSGYDDDIITPTSGEENAWIVIKGEGKNRPILKGKNNLLTAINLSGVSYVKIENLEITHDTNSKGNDIWFREGIEILEKPSSHIILENLYIHHIDEFGMNIQDVDNLLILNCKIEYCGFGALGGPLGNFGGWKNVKIKNCTLSYSGHYYQGGDGSSRPYDRPDGFGIEPSEGPIEVLDTIVKHNYGDGIDSKAENTYIHRCIVANNSCDGVKVWGNNSKIENTLIYGRGDGNPQETPWAAIVIDQVEKENSVFEIVNVTVDDFLGKNYLMYVQYGVDIPIKLIIRNTILCGRGNNSPIYIGDSVDLLAEFNLFYLPKSEYVLEYKGKQYTSKNIEMLGKGNIYGDPLFILPAWGSEGDYHLQNKSPAIDNGTSTNTSNYDLEEKLRPQGKGYDIGAYEK